MKKDFDELLKKAYKQGKIKDLSDAFEEFPSEEEWHQGKIENVIKEEAATYGTIYSIGDIVFVKNYLYANGNTGHNHLFVIVGQNNIAVPIENFGMLISSNLNKLKYSKNILLKKNKKNSLDHDSLVKTDVMYKILNKDILFKIGEVEKDKIEEYLNSFDN